MPDTAELELDTAVEAEAPLLEEAPETDVELSAPETEGDESPETQPLDKDDPRVAEIIKAERAKIEESYRRRAEHSQRQQRIAAYEEARQQAETYRATSAYDQIEKMVKKAVEEGDEPDLAAIKNIVSATNAGGILDVLEGMEGWTNSYLRRAAPKFFSSLPEDDPINIEWVDAKLSKNPAQLFAVALKAAQAAGEQAGREAAKAEAEKEAKARAAARQKTEQIRNADQARAQQGRPNMNLNNGVPRRMTLKEIDQMPTEQWLSIPVEERRRLRAEAR